MVNYWIVSRIFICNNEFGDVKKKYISSEVSQTSGCHKVYLTHISLGKILPVL